MTSFFTLLQSFVIAMKSGHLPELGYWTYLVLAFLVAIEGPLATLLGAAAASAGLIDYRAAITVQNSGGTQLGYVTTDPSYWTPLLSPNISNAFLVDFTLDGTSGSAVNLTVVTPTQGFSYFGLTQGRDSTSADIGSGNFNYLYLEGTNATAPGSTPQQVGNYFSTATGLSHPSESAIWTIAINGTTGTLNPVWVNTDGTTPTTQTFVQSNHLYAGGDAAAFHTRFPAPVTPVTLNLEILSAEAAAVPEPASWLLLAVGGFVYGTQALWRGRLSRR